MKPKFDKEIAMKRLREDNLTEVSDCYEGSEWTGAKQGQPTKEEVMQGEIDRLGRVIRKLELELSEARFDKAMLMAELNARGVK